MCFRLHRYTPCGELHLYHGSCFQRTYHKYQGVFCTKGYPTVQPSNMCRFRSAKRPPHGRRNLLVSNVKICWQSLYTSSLELEALLLPLYYRWRTLARHLFDASLQPWLFYQDIWYSNPNIWSWYVNSIKWQHKR